MDVNKAFRYVFEDKQGLSKLLIGVLISLLSFLILPAFILQGYLVKIIRHVMGGNDNDLPEWTDWGKLLVDGLAVAIGQFIWTLPFFLVFIIGTIATTGLGSMAEGGSDAAAAGAMGGGLLLACLGLLFAVAFLFMTPALMIQYAMKDEFSAMFRFSEVFDIIRNHTADILIAFLVTLVAGMAIGLLGLLMMVTIILIPVVMLLAFAVNPYIQYATGHLYGQIARKISGGKAAVYDQGSNLV